MCGSKAQSSVDVDERTVDVRNSALVNLLEPHASLVLDTFSELAHAHHLYAIAPDVVPHLVLCQASSSAPRLLPRRRPRPRQHREQRRMVKIGKVKSVWPAAKVGEINAVKREYARTHVAPAFTGMAGEDLANEPDEHVLAGDCTKGYEVDTSGAHCPRSTHSFDADSRLYPGP